MTICLGMHKQPNHADHANLNKRRDGCDLHANNIDSKYQHCATTPVGVMDTSTKIFANIVRDGDGLN